MDSVFSKKFEWSLAPLKPSIDIESAAQRKRYYENNFRWLRSDRLPEFCRPYRMAYELGWQILSPIDIILYPIEEIQFQASQDELDQIANKSNFTHLWNREGTFIGVRTTMHLRMYDFKVADGWEAMFILNGDSSLEWKLGLDVNLSEGCSLLLIDDYYKPKHLCVPGILSQKQLLKMNASSGLSIAVRPLMQKYIKRGDVIARAIIISDASL